MNYKLDMNELKIVAEEGEEIVCEADVSINEGVATVNFVSIKHCTVALASQVCAATKKLLAEQGIVVDKAICGGILAVTRFDEHLAQMDKGLNENLKVSSMR